MTVVKLINTCKRMNFHTLLLTHFVLLSCSLFLLLTIFFREFIIEPRFNAESNCPTCKLKLIKSALSSISSKQHYDKLNLLNQLCPVISPLLVGKKVVDLSEASKDEQWFHGDNEVILGGSYLPKGCHSRHKVAIVVPYRNRSHQLAIFLRHMHPFLQRQQLSYTIFVIEQTDAEEINRGTLKNIGFLEALRREFYECFFFHDVDYLPEDDRNSYACPKTPKRMAVIQSDWNYIEMSNFFGGVVGFPTGDFARINGYSNFFWGWGGEDNNLLDRVFHHNMTVEQLDDSIIHFSRYTVQSHVKAVPSVDRFKFLDLPLNYSKYDGLTSLKYRMINNKLEPLYTHVVVELENNISKS